MKKIIVLILVLAIVCGLCACASAPEDTTRIGYVIIPHADGDEHADIYDWTAHSGIMFAYCVDGRVIASPQIIIVLES